MNIASAILAFVRALRYQAVAAPKTKYRDGYVDALNEVDEHITNEGWQDGSYDDDWDDEDGHEEDE